MTIARIHSAGGRKPESGDCMIHFLLLFEERRYA